MPAPPHLTAAQLAKQAERKAAKLARKAANASGTSAEALAEAERRKVIARNWVQLKTSDRPHKARIVTWNMLAQTLVRRDLFPGSDCLRWSDRRPMLQAEMASHADADECDRLDDMLSSVPDHTPISTKGPGKLHGLVVLYRKGKYLPVVTKALALDDEFLNPDAGSDVARRGVSRQTRNMGLIVALKENDGGIIVVTTHLFWHPKFMYERTRQVIVLLRAARKLASEHGLESWPIVFAGDLNTEPDESTYQMLVAPGVPLHQHLVDTFNASRIVHDNVVKVGVQASVQPGDESTTPSQNASGAVTPDDDNEDALPDTDERSIANTRPPRPDDGIATLESLMAIGGELMRGGAISAYGDNSWGGEQSFAARGGFPPGVTGAGGGEPAYTCFTPKFHLTLDYLFLVPPNTGSSTAEFTALLAPPPTEALGAGLPRKGVSASDHLPIGCDIAW